MMALSRSAVGSQDDVSLVRILASKTVENGAHDVNSSTKDSSSDDNEATKWLEQAAGLLNQQWPRGGSTDAYKVKVINEQPQLSNRQLPDDDDDDDDALSSAFYGLPSSYLLIQNGNDCIGHGRLTECFESAGGNAAAMTFIVINSTKQYHGFGRKLMTLLEDEAKRLGYHYIYLWTKTAIGFYEKNGYAQCERVSLKRPCLKRLVTEEVESLEALLVKRQSKINMASSKTDSTVGKKNSVPTVGKKKETIMLPPDEDGNDLPDIWMKKRLVEQVGSIHLPMDQLISELEKVADEVAASDVRLSNQDNDNSLASNYWYYRIVLIPWQAQIGPSCGLAALRMVREYFMASENDEPTSDGEEQEQLPSLLQEAQARGFTQDGEIFDANHLKEMAVAVCGIDSETLSVPELTPSAVNAALANGGVFILPYDSAPKSRLPAKLSGQKAHYGIIVGIAIVTDSPMAAEGDQTFRQLQPLASEQEKLMDGDRSQVYLMVQHGLSSNLCIAPWSAFVESNAQLVEFDENKFGSVKLDLKNRIIVCKGLQS